MRAFGIAVASTLIAFAFSSPTAADEGQHKTVAGAGLAAIGSYFESHPEMMLDFTAVSGEYCINTWKAGGSHMSHYAVDPASTREDVIDFVKADSMSKMGVDVDKLPRFPGQLGAMEPGTWYYLPAGRFEPHHGKKLPMALMMRASNIE
jgi:hypothetical protein